MFKTGAVQEHNSRYIFRPYPPQIAVEMKYLHDKKFEVTLLAQ
jgi:hypothetical protein